jgi:Tfp pilus assembly protein PilF
MPYASHDDKLASMRRWREKKMAEGYGKALYARRKLRYRNEEILRVAVVMAYEKLQRGNAEGARKLLERALEDAPEVKGTPLDFMPEK